VTFYKGKKDVHKDGSITQTDSYACKTHVVTGRAKCSWHRIYENPLKRIILDNIKQQAALIQLDESGMLQRLQKKMIEGYAVDKTEISTERHNLKQELHSIDMTIEKLYEDKITGIVTTELFTQMAGKTEIRRQEVEDRLTALVQMETEAKTKLSDIQNWIRLIKENATVDEVDRDLLDTLVDHVEVGEPMKENGVKTQDVWIYYKYVGLVKDYGINIRQGG
jgi:hypothetical protein